MIKKTLAFTSPAYLSLRNGQLVVKFPDKEKAERTIPVEDIGVVVLEHRQITVSHALLSALLDNDSAVVTSDGNSMPSGLLLPLAVNTIQSERFSNQIKASVPLKKKLWQQTIQCKIRNQAAALNAIYEERFKNMLAWANDVKSGDSDNKEARAAAFYWKTIFATVPDYVRGRDEAPPNNLLNYGYAILRAVVARALVASGLLPTLGIHHHNRYNAYCLADDVMEPYRPFVDLVVYDIVASGDDYFQLSKDIKSKLLQIPTVDVTIDGKRSPLMVAASLTASSLSKCYAGDQRKILYPELTL